MALTQEQQVIFDAVISSIRTNSKTIAQMTPQTALGADDWFELNGARKVSYSVLSSLIKALLDEDLETMRKLISKNTLKSVNFDVSSETAALTIASNDTSITCEVPVAAEDAAGIITGVDKTKIRIAYDTSLSASTTANAAKMVTDTAGQPGGLATLDAAGKLNAGQVPGYLNEGLRGGATARFSAIVEEDVETQAQGSGSGLEPGDEVSAGTVNGGGGTVTALATVVYLRKKKAFAQKDNGHYYLPWESGLYPMWQYNESATHCLRNKVFLCGGKAYVWDIKAADLVELAGDKAAAKDFVTLSESDYAALANKDDNTYYFIYED